jgi:alpha-beta hydrolase superfamily lysophospholipase
MRTEGCNVIAVDWQKGAQNPLYGEARANTKLVGEYLAELLGFLAQSTGAKLQEIHCMGHSLGAHVCGYNGKALNGELGRITGAPIHNKIIIALLLNPAKSIIFRIRSCPATF